MQPALRAAAAGFVAMITLCNAEAGSSVTAVQKVIELLTDMKAKAQQMKDAEAIKYAEFKQFCADTTRTKEQDIKDADALIEKLSAEIGKLESDTAELSAKIKKLGTSIEESQAKLKEAASRRDADHSSYQGELGDLTETVDALERAIRVLGKQNYDRKQAAEALLQVTSFTSIPETVQRTVAAFLEMQTGQDFITAEAPEASAYEFQSTSILDLLKKLHDEFDKQKTECEKGEINSRHAHEILSQDLHDQVEIATADREQATVQLQEKKKILAEDKKELKQTQTDRDNDAQYLKELKLECEEKGKSFDEKQDLRTEEVEAIQKAIDILSSDDVTGNAEKHLPAALMQQSKKATSFAHLRTISHEHEPSHNIRRALADFLKGEGHRLHSQRIGMLAERVAASSDPFAKVKQLINDLIQRLLEEANAESEHKGWCDKELGTNKITRSRLQDQMDDLTSKIDETDAFIIQSTERIAKLSKESEELTKAMEEATKLRVEEKAKNEETMQDAADAQRAVREATAVLKEFYAKASTATAFLQGPVKMGSEEWDALANPNFDGTIDKGHKQGMQTFGEKYTGMQAEGGGVLAMLEVIQSDFATLESETNAAEAEAMATYKDFMASSKKSLAVKAKESEMLTADKATSEEELSSTKKDLADSQDQMLASGRYYDKLVPTCVNTGVSYEKRAQAREDEIQSLKEALQILSGEDIAA